MKRFKRFRGRPMTVRPAARLAGIVAITLGVLGCSGGTNPPAGPAPQIKTVTVPMTTC